MLLKSNQKCYLKERNKNTYMKITEETKIRKQGEISLITTIPKTYVKILDLKNEDNLEWIFNTETEKLELKIIRH